MENPNLNDVVKDTASNDYHLACQASRQRDAAEKLRVKAMIASTPEQARLYEDQANGLMEGRKTVAAQISLAGAKYNV